MEDFESRSRGIHNLSNARRVSGITGWVTGAPFLFFWGDDERLTRIFVRFDIAASSSLLSKVHSLALETRVHALAGGCNCTDLMIPPRKRTCSSYLLVSSEECSSTCSHDGGIQAGCSQGQHSILRCKKTGMEKTWTHRSNPGSKTTTSSPRSTNAVRILKIASVPPEWTEISLFASRSRPSKGE